MSPVCRHSRQTHRIKAILVTLAAPNVIIVLLQTREALASEEQLMNAWTRLLRILPNVVAEVQFPAANERR